MGELLILAEPCSGCILWHTARLERSVSERHLLTCKRSRKCRVIRKLKAGAGREVRWGLGIIISQIREQV